MKKLIDFDGLFEEKLAEYMKINAGKYTEKQWESLIPKLYKQFGDIFVASAGDTPKGYYRAMTDGELVESLVRHIEEDVPVSDFLLREIESRGCIDGLLALLKSKDERQIALAVTLAGSNERAFPAYFELLTAEISPELKEEVIERLKENPSAAKEHALLFFEKGVLRDVMLELLSRVKERDERVFDVLMKEFKAGEELPLHAGYLAAYGDERALDALLEVVDRDDINYLEYRELKCAIEALGGEYTRERDFSQDCYFLEIAEQSAASVDPEKKDD